MQMKRRLFPLVFASLAALAAALPARAEPSEIRIAKQYGLGYLQLIVMEDQKLVEKHAKAQGLGDVKVTWATFRSSDVMNDALLSGSVDFVCLGPTGIATIWAKTGGQVKAVSGLNFIPLQLNSRSDRIKGIRDFSDKDKIALPAVKVSLQATLLQIWAAKEFGDANKDKLDPLTVSMTHSDGMVAFLSGAGEINNHFTSPPFIQKEMARPGVHKVITSTEILGGPISFNVIAASAKFQQANPKAYGAFVDALQEATEWINHNQRAAAETYLRVTKDKMPLDELMAIMNAPGIEFSLVPKNLVPLADFMYKTGSIKVKPASWKDLFFPNAYSMQGS
jgi:NitT/TauT family transport system substrate-binding protein